MDREDVDARCAIVFMISIFVLISLDDAHFLDADARSVFDNHLIMRIVTVERHLQGDMELRETGQFGIGTSRQERC